ncbi:hypothetical protein PtB15_3B335 [Puccinia triticina]|nr:hypothetical protein PtB15_3B335 [Puccinia triticina]
MARLGKSNPFQHETSQQRKRRLKHTSRNTKGQEILNSLLRGEPLPSDTQPAPDIDSTENYLLDFGSLDFETSTGPENHDNPLSAWSSIPWLVESELTATRDHMPCPAINPEDRAALRQHDRRVTHETRANNWNDVMTKLFRAYLWLKNETDNWTAPSSFESHEEQFCNCEEHDRRKTEWVDLVDTNGDYTFLFAITISM